MIEITTSMAQLHFGELMEVYSQSNLHYGKQNWPDEPPGLQIANAEQELYTYLRTCFFPDGGTIYCLREGGRYVCALRLEPYRDGLLLTALETAPQYRGRGYATRLIREMLRQQGLGRIYSHIDKRNVASIKVHEACGFRRVLEYAVYLDGSVAQNAATFLIIP